jgi:hypothetical protein
VNDRELRVAFGLKNCSRFPKSAARNDDGNRRECWWRKPAKPREIGGMLPCVSLTFEAIYSRSTCVKEQLYESYPAAMQWSNLENVGMVVRALGGSSAKLRLLLNISAPNNPLSFAHAKQHHGPSPKRPHGFNCCGIQGVGARRHSAAPQPWREKR